MCGRIESFMCSGEFYYLFTDLELRSTLLAGNSLDPRFMCIISSSYRGEFSIYKTKVLFVDIRY